MIDNLSLKILEPREAACLDLAAKYKGLVIKGVDDEEGYDQVYRAKQILKKERTGITNDGKSLREMTNDFNKSVLKKERELIAIIEPIEKELTEALDVIDAEKAKISRLEVLPLRMDKLIAINPDFAKLGDKAKDNILDMDGNQFQEFLNNLMHEKLAAKETRLKAENDRIEAERAKLEQEKHDEEIRKQARLLAEKEAFEEQARLVAKAEKDKADAITAVKDKADADALEAKRKSDQEKQDLIDAQVKVETDRLKKIKDDKAKLEADELAKDKLEAEELAKTIEAQKNKKYADFLTEYGVTNDNATDFYIKKIDVEGGGKQFILYKKLGDITI